MTSLDLETSLVPAGKVLNVEDNNRTRAYLLWEAEGRQDGGADYYWHRACELVQAEHHADYPPTQARAHRA